MWRSIEDAAREGRPMRIVQAVWGVFHHFDLARELDARGHLKTVYSTFPWARLKREGLPHSKVETFPTFHVAQFAIGRFVPGWRFGLDAAGYINTILFDEWLNSRLPKDGVDALIALSGAGLNTGKRLQKQGGVFICDRGSTHQRVQTALLQDEFKRWGIEFPQTRIADALCNREEAIYDVADAVTVPSSFAARSFVDSGIPQDKVHVIPYGVRLERFQKVADPPRDRFEVLFVGSVGLRKGIPYLLQAFGQVSHPQKRLRVVGGMQPELTSVLPGFRPVISPTLPTQIRRSRNVMRKSVQEWTQVRAARQAGQETKQYQEHRRCIQYETDPFSRFLPHRLCIV